MNNENEFNLNGRRYVAVDTTGTCEGCVFEGDETGCGSTPPCSPRRSDGRNVIYVELPKPKTNGDWLRSLNNEELAAELHELATSAIAHTVKDLAGKFELPEDVRTSDRRRLKEWLDSPLTKGDCK